MSSGTRAGSGKAVIANVQVLRGISALLVIFCHLRWSLSSLGVPAFGSGGVDIFFVISGFIMVHTTIGREMSPLDFMADRFARIVPSYWTITFLVFSIALVAPTLLQATRASWIDLGKSMAFIPYIKSNGLTEPILFVGWTLNYEIFFYLVFAIGLVVPNKKLGLSAVTAALIALVATGMLLQPSSVLARFYTSPVMLDFACGLIIGVIYQRFSGRAALLVKVATVLLVVLGFAALVLLPLLAEQSPRFLLCGAPAALVVSGALLLERWSWRIGSMPMLRLGAASYSIYLIHPFVTQSAEKLSLALHTHGLASLAIIAVALVVACAVGTLMHEVLERPLSRATRHWLNVRRLNPRAAVLE